MTKCSVAEAGSRIGALFDQALAGESVLLVKGGSLVLLQPLKEGGIPARPPGYFDDCYSPEEATESNLLAAQSTTALVL